MIEKMRERLHEAVMLPMTRFMSQEKSGGIVLAIAVIVALVLANSPLREAYEHSLHRHFGFVVDGVPYFNFSISHWINDGLMSMFFFVVGLELKREFIGGELREIRKVVLPVGAAVCGMVFPALVYTALNFGTEQAHGWGIPMATDIAFALALVYLLGKRVPLSAKVFLTTLAIVDDLGSVIVIALFYTSHISMMNLAIGCGFLAVLYAGNRLGVKNVAFYGIIGIAGVWTAFLMSGVHATISAVMVAFMIPADSKIAENTFMSRLRKQLHLFERAEPNDVSTLEHDQLAILARMKQETIDAIPPLQRLEHALHPFVAFVVMPIFALANAGLALSDINPAGLIENGVALGVMLGLLVGKPVGVLLSVWLLQRLGMGQLSEDMNMRHVIGLGFLAAIGFTMSIFVTTLAFKTPDYMMQAKAGIFAASLLGGTIGYLLLRRS